MKKRKRCPSCTTNTTLRAVNSDSHEFACDDQEARGWESTPTEVNSDSHEFACDDQEARGWESTPTEVNSDAVRCPEPA